ncbi:MAG TPA: pyridoxal phosphate-dependent aminotransferase [Actinocrinis sp.]|jgi:alanine-synthesizing transaminase|uniref:pyridoxal phosphate-dependent aminotransferase n=1 Tax=Actinocrinis sp. TaxID=1920516 RepID=UPI002DDCA301|nr:pyridoxal phosphate-dependent aminotransferase [Actinocrinis sp.]HEV3170322.1 pyridoxal phosphate-dependent aminotransferase [Actinocrinis sp.]
MEFKQSRKLSEVQYDLRGPVLTRAKQLEAEGHTVLKLNIGNPAPFGFEAPDELVQDVILHLHESNGYGDSKGLPSARRAVVQSYQTRGLNGLDIEDVYIGNGVSELIGMVLNALLDHGDEVLIPAPDYPLWTGATALAGGKPVHYLCDEQADWAPDLADIEAKISDRTKALVLINPNNPTGAVYPQEVVDAVVEIARRHRLMVLSDEIYDKILYDGATHRLTALSAPDLLTITFNGLSKTYRAAGYRMGWMVLSGPKEHAEDYIQGLEILANLRLGANVPVQHAIQAAVGGFQSIDRLTEPGGRLWEQRNRTWELLNQIPGVSCTKPLGAIYAFPRLDPSVYKIADDERFVMDLLNAEKMLVMHGTAFNWPQPDHFRIVTLPRVEDLERALDGLARFLAGYQQ